MSDIPAEGLRFIASAVRRGANPPGVPALLDEAAAELTRLRADLAQLEQESDAEIALLRDYLASAERHRAEEMEERHRLAREVICLRADLAAAQEREQRMREALKPGLANLDALLNDHGYAEDGGLRGIVSELRAALGEPQ